LPDHSPRLGQITGKPDEADPDPALGVSLSISVHQSSIASRGDWFSIDVQEHDGAARIVAIDPDR
jgi:hypothetical protein